MYVMRAFALGAELFCAAAYLIYLILFICIIYARGRLLCLDFWQAQVGAEKIFKKFSNFANLFALCSVYIM